MSSRIISADRVARLLASCEMLLLRIEAFLVELQKRAMTEQSGVYSNVALEPRFDQLVRDVTLFVACACAAPERMATRLETLAPRFPASTLQALLTTAVHEIRGEE